MKTLREFREQTNKTLVEVAVAVRASDATISRIERGLQNPSPALARRLEAFTGIPAGVFVMGDASTQSGDEVVR